MKRLIRTQAQALFKASARRAPRQNPEEQLQIAVCEYLALAAPDLVWFHVPNGEKRSKATAGRLKAMGVRAGVPDLCIILPDGRAAFIELKAPKGQLSPAQKDFLLALPAAAPWALCRRVEDVERMLRAWGVPLRASMVGRVA